MTTELEKQFFECFGIEPKMLCDCEYKNLYDYRIEYGQDVCIHSEDEKNCQDCELAKQIHPLYPEITDRKLLELFAIDNVTTYEELKIYILCRIIYNYENDENKRCQVKALFEDKEQ